MQVKCEWSFTLNFCKPLVYISFLFAEGMKHYSFKGQMTVDFTMFICFSSMIGSKLSSCTLLFNLFKMAGNKSLRKCDITSHKEVNVTSARRVNWRDSKWLPIKVREMMASRWHYKWCRQVKWWWYQKPSKPNPNPATCKEVSRGGLMAWRGHHPCMGQRQEREISPLCTNVTNGGYPYLGWRHEGDTPLFWLTP